MEYSFITSLRGQKKYWVVSNFLEIVLRESLLYWLTFKCIHADYSLIYCVLVKYSSKCSFYIWNPYNCFHFQVDLYLMLVSFSRRPMKKQPTFMCGKTKTFIHMDLSLSYRHVKHLQILKVQTLIHITLWVHTLSTLRSHFINSCFICIIWLKFVLSFFVYFVKRKKISFVFNPQLSFSCNWTIVILHSILTSMEKRQINLNFDELILKHLLYTFEGLFWTTWMYLYLVFGTSVIENTYLHIFVYTCKKFCF